MGLCVSGNCEGSCSRQLRHKQDDFATTASFGGMTVYLPLSDAPTAPRTTYSSRGGTRLETQPHRGEAKADILIIGGGIAGVSAALRAVELGADVMLLEANEIGWGASSRNGGHVAPATKLTPQEVERRYGPVYGPRLNEASENGPDLVFELTERHKIDASVVRSGNLIAIHTETALKGLEARARYLQQRGRPVQILDRQQAAKVTGSNFYLGAYRDDRGGTINPLAYVRGLARAAVAGGARIHERSKVIRLKKSASGWTAETVGGTVTARHVLICTNAYTDNLWPGLRQTIIPVRTYQLGSTPLPEAVQKTILPGREGMTDTRRLLSGIRMKSDGRLHFGGIGALFGPEKGLDETKALGRLIEVFPQANQAKVDFWWSGWMAMSISNAWQLHELAHGVVTALGCNGRGVAIATFLGREMAEHAMGKQEKDLVVPFTPLRKMPLHWMHQPFVDALVRYYSFRDNVELRKLRRTNKKIANAKPA